MDFALEVVGRYQARHQRLNSPAGPMALIRDPGLRLPSIQQVPMLSGCALAVTVIDLGREAMRKWCRCGARGRRARGFPVSETDRAGSRTARPKARER